MKCFYEVLEVSRDVSADDLKKSYRKLALKWHPDKNPDCVEEAKEQFQLIQQAYEVLGDPRERQWYDNHREYIINSGDTPVNELNLFKYFSPSCYKGFGDDDNGFYSVYREVFNTVLAEESVYFDVDPDEIPTFGRSDSDYADIVRPFYNFWCGFNTHKPFGWLDEYDIRQAPNRRVAKMMEKENKKIRDKAKRERNDEIQALVEFVRKRDKRVKAYAESLKLKSAENSKRMEEARRKRIKEKQKEMASYKETEWSKFSNVEAELKLIEDSLIAEYGSGDDEVESEDETANCLYCVACNKVFKTDKAFQNHEKSKKHKENIELIKVEMLNDEELFNNGVSVENNSSDDDDDDDRNRSDVESAKDEADSNSSTSDKESYDSSNSEIDRMEFNKESNNTRPVRNEIDSDSISESDLSSDEQEEEEEITSERKRPNKKNKKQSISVDEVNVLYCLACHQSFKTEKALHNHKTSKKHQDNVVLLSAKKTNDDDHNPVCDDSKNDQVSETVIEEVSKENVPQEVPITEKSTKNKKKPKIIDNTKVKKSNHVCGVCSSVFSSKNKLHQHLKDANHAVLKTVVVNERKCKKKGKC